MRAAAFILAAVPVIGHAEGARIVFECESVQTCDAMGSCRGGAPQAVGFTLQPRQTDENGMGQYDLLTDAYEAEAQSISRLGPFVWTDNDGRIATLILSTPQSAVLHMRTPTSPFAAELQFLTCEVTQ